MRSWRRSDALIFLNRHFLDAPVAQDGPTGAQRDAVVETKRRLPRPQLAAREFRKGVQAGLVRLLRCFHGFIYFL